MPGVASLLYPASVGADHFRCVGSILKRHLALQSAPFFHPGWSVPEDEGYEEGEVRRT